MKKMIALLLCVGLVLGMLAGCSSQEGYVPTGNALEREDQIVTAPPADDGGEKERYSLAYYNGESFNPYQATGINNQMLFSLIYQGLFAVNRSYEAEGILCKSYTVSDDFCTYTFTLDTATFSDGVPVTAADVVASLKAAREGSFYAGRFDQIDSISELDTRTVEIVTACAYENLPLLLDIPVVKASEVEGAHPLGTGPYVLNTTVSGYVLSRTANWWCSAPLPIDAVVITLKGYDTAAQIRDGFQYDDIGISVADPGAFSYAQYRSDCELWEMETGLFLYLGCNAVSGVLSNNEIRMALTHAIDRAGILEKCYNGFGHAATLAASPSSPFYSKVLAETIGYDTTRLAQAVTDSGLTGSTVIFLVNDSDFVRLSAARMIAATLTECGLVVQMEECHGDAYYERLETNNFDLYLGQTRLSATMDLGQFFSADGELNYGGMTNPSIYTMCRKALENSGNYYNLHDMIIEDGQLIPILFRTYAVYAQRGLVNGLSPSRDNVFYYSLGKTLDLIQTEWIPEESTEPETQPEE